MSHPLIDRLTSPVAGERAAACRDAVQDPSAVLLADALAEALGDTDPGVARAASDALVAIGPRCEQLEALLRRALRSGRPNARWAAAFASARLSPPGPGLLPPLVEALGSAWGGVRWRAAQLLVRLGAVVPEVRPLLAGLSRQDDRPLIRRMATHCLRELAPGDDATVEVLLAVTGDDDAAVRRAAVSALAALDTPLPGVAERLLAVAGSDPDPAGRRLAVNALGEVAARCPEALPADGGTRLQALLAASEDDEERREISRIVARLADATPTDGPRIQNDG